MFESIQITLFWESVLLMNFFHRHNKETPCSSADKLA